MGSHSKRVAFVGSRAGSCLLLGSKPGINAKSPHVDFDIYLRARPCKIKRPSSKSSTPEGWIFHRTHGPLQAN